jgi:hypothetical protein
MFPEVADDQALAVTADRGFDSQFNHDLLRERGQESAIVPKKIRGKKKGHVKSMCPNSTSAHVII